MVLVWCKACHHQGPADLQAIIDRGLGDRPLKDLKFRCAQCGSRLTDAVMMGKAAWACSRGDLRQEKAATSRELPA